MKQKRIYCGVAWMLIFCTGLVGCISHNLASTPSPSATSEAKPTYTFVPTLAHDTSTPMETDCNGDNLPQTPAPGWKILWQHVFEQPIARPPIIEGSQLFLLERGDPILPDVNFKDAVWTMNPQTAEVQWRFGDTLSSRHVLDMKWSKEYLAMEVVPLPPDLPPSLSGSQGNPIVLERSSGRIAYNGPGVEVSAISDDALFYRSNWRALNRIDLPTGVKRWYAPNTSNSWGYLFVDSTWLYAFGFDGGVYKYDPVDGRLVVTGTLGLISGGDLIVQDEVGIVRSSQPAVVALFDLQTFKTQWMTEVSYLQVKGSNAYGVRGDLRSPSMALTSDSIYLFDAQDNLVRISRSSGRIMWRASSPEPEPMSRPAAAQGFVYGLYADGTLRAYSEADGSEAGIVMKVPLYYWRNTDTKEWRNLVGGLGVAGDTLIVTTGCRSVYAIQREP